MKNYELTLCGVKRILPFVDLENDWHLPVL